MRLGYDNLQAMPLTSTKLNFYLAQCNRSNSKNEKQQSYLNHSNIDHCIRHKNVKSSRQNLNDFQNDCCSQNNISLPKVSNKENWSPIKQQKIVNDSGVSINVRQNCDSFSNPLPLCHNDSLDNLIKKNYNNIRLQSRMNQRATDRTYNYQKNSIENQSFYPIKIKNNHSTVPMSTEICNEESYLFNNEYHYIPNKSFPPNQQQIFIQYSPRSIIKNKQNKISEKRQSKVGSKRVNWRTQSRKLSKKNSYKVKFDEGFRQISNHLSAITYELNNNTRKLQQLNRIYGSKKKSPLNPHETLQRANKKYACRESLNKDSRYEFRTRPEVEYDRHLFNDPKYLIWQPCNGIYRRS